MKPSRAERRSLAGVGIRSVLAKLIEVECRSHAQRRSLLKNIGENHEYRNDLNHPLSRVLIGRRRLVLWSALTSKRDHLNDMDRIGGFGDLGGSCCLKGSVPIQ